MKKSFRVTLTALFCLSLPLSALAGSFPTPSVEYFGDSHVEANGMAMAMKIYQAKDKQRIEMNNPQMGGKSIMIMRMDKKVGWNLMPEQKMYSEINLEDAKKRSGDMRECTWDASEKGSESVNGISTKKQHAKVSCPDSDYEGDFWITSEGIGVKMDITGKTKGGEQIHMKQEMRNLKIGKLDPDLFEIPAGYTSMGNVNTMMQDMQRQMDDAKKQQAQADEEMKKQQEANKAKAAEDAERAKKDQAAREYSEKKRKEAGSSAPTSVDDAVKGGLKKLFKW